MKLSQLFDHIVRRARTGTTESARSAESGLAPVVITRTNGSAFSASYSMNVSTVNSCVRLISESIARLPLELQRWNNYRGFFVPERRSKLAKVLRLRPNNNLTHFVLIQNCVIDSRQNL